MGAASSHAQKQAVVLQNRVIQHNSSFTEWTPEMAAFFGQGNIDAGIVQQAFNKSRALPGSTAKLDAFLQTPDNAWTPRDNDQLIAVWMASGDIDYLRQLKTKLPRISLDAQLSGNWAVNSLSRQYNLPL